MAAFFFECKFCSWAWIAFVFLNRPKGPDLSEHYKNRTNRNCGKPYVPSSHSPLFLAKLLIGLTLFDTSARYILAFCTVAQLTCNEESSWSQRGGVFFFPPAIFGKKIDRISSAKEGVENSLDQNLLVISPMNRNATAWGRCSAPQNALRSHIHDVVIHGCRPLARHLQKARLADVGFAGDDLAPRWVPTWRMGSQDL